MPYRKEDSLPDNFEIDWASGKESGHNFITHLFITSSVTKSRSMNLHQEPIFVSKMLRL
jgi:hypothetical protein